MKMLKKECLYCHNLFYARTDSMEYCSAWHHKLDTDKGNKVKRKRSRKFDPYFTETFFEDENYRRANRHSIVK